MTDQKTTSYQYVSSFYNNPWLVLLENNPKRLPVVVLFFLCILQSLELARSFIISKWSKATSALRLKLVISTSTSYITLILMVFVWFQYRLNVGFDSQGPNAFPSRMGLFASSTELVINFIVGMSILAAQFISLEPHSILTAQHTKIQNDGTGQKTTVYTHYVLVVLINILSLATIIISMTDFYTNALQLLL